MYVPYFSTLKSREILFSLIQTKILYIPCGASGFKE